MKYRYFTISLATGNRLAPSGEHYDVEAKAEDEATPTTDRLRQMLRSLLADRFQLTLHREMKELPVYVLVIANRGAKFRELRKDEPIPTYATRPPEMATVKGTFFALLSLLRVYADRPVVDETGLTGRYEYADLGLGQFAQERRADPVGAQAMLSSAVLVVTGRC